MLAQSKFNRYHSEERECELQLIHTPKDLVDGTIKLVLKDNQNDTDKPTSMRFLRMKLTIEEAIALRSQLSFAIDSYSNYLVAAKRHASSKA